MNKITKRIMLGLFLVLILSIANYAHADEPMHGQHNTAHDGVLGEPVRLCSLGLSNIEGNIRVDVGLDRDGNGQEDWSMELSMTPAQLQQLRNADRNNQKVKITYDIDPCTMEYKVFDIVEIDDDGCTIL